MSRLQQSDQSVFLEKAPVDYYNCTGGMDTVSSSVTLGPSKFKDAQNINLFPIGGYQWRNGYTTLNSSPVSSSTCQGLHMPRFSNGNTAVLIAGTKLYTMPSTLNGTWTDKTNGVTLSSGNTVVWNFSLLNDTMVACNDTDTCIQMDNTLTVSTLGGSPVFTSALFCVEHLGYMFYGQTVESATRQYDRLRFSDINAPNSFTSLGSNNFIDVAKKTSGDLRGAVSFNGNLYAFKRNGIYLITFQPTQVNSSGVIFPFSQYPVAIVPKVGTQSHRSIVKFTTPITNQRQSGVELVFFVDQFGMPRIFDGTTTLQVGYPIQQCRDTTITTLNSMNSAQLPYCWAINYPLRNQIWLFMSKNSNLMDTCWVLDYSVGFAWTRHSFATQFASGAIFETSTGAWQPFTGDYAGTVYQQDSGSTDNGTAISSYVVHGDAFLGSPTINSSWLWIEMKGATGNNTQYIQLDFYPNGSDNPTLTLQNIALQGNQTTWGTTGPGGTMTWGTSKWAKAGLTTVQKEINMDAKTLRVKVSNMISGNTLTLEGFSIAARPLGTSQALS